MQQTLRSLIPLRVLWAYRMFKAYASYEIVQKGGPPVHYDKDGMRITHKTDHLTERRFAKAFQTVLDNGAVRDLEGKNHDNVEWRFYNLCWIAEHVKNLGGDYVECGVYKGGASRAVCEYIDFNSLDKDFFLLDTFAGVPLHLLLPHEQQPYNYARHDSYVEIAKANFKKFPRARIIEGQIPETLEQVHSRKIAYLHIDLNSLTAEIAALDFFWDRMVPGGFLVSDDYGHGGHEPQRAAWDEWAEKKGLKVWVQPTAQGILIKPAQPSIL